MGEATYLVVYMTETDGEPVIKRMTRAEIIRFCESVSPEDIAIISGYPVKAFGKKLDIGRLKE